ncbi:hypothetical protein BKH46_08095 [Helicobacter sp. 12S02634-8]|uniref:GspE/PulE family protein n=1 Tax=Helicobacter sp. 12S02634-8 TaxID=1476199 RepID=UPI000BA714B8|nr:GspE/PulE family protein [Helicobacter sp. 12S02634-8]PAF46264.1 hypothetical protein BKH46_08095 [Helicobacter sp. 12S02634-8]
MANTQQNTTQHQAQDNTQNGVQDWIIDEQSSALLPYELACKLQAFVLAIHPSKHEIILGTQEDTTQQNIPALKELIKQKYPTYTIQFTPLAVKDFYTALQYLQIQEKVHIFSAQITDLKSPETSIAGLYHYILEQAISQNASDIHLEPKGTHASFKIRKDGHIKELSKIKPKIFELLCNKIKLESKLDISEKRLPQDGRYSFLFLNKEYDFRISSVPTQHGESIVMRILYKQTRPINLDYLNLNTSHCKLLQKTIQSPNGIILITGPTGSGKSTTLYALLEDIKSHDKKLITIEDPIEYQIPLATQIQINPDYGFGFSDALRAILRQDPDIIMVGEIRDQETLQLAVQSSLTGHLVLSTIHTNDCISTIDRLLDMGTQPYLLHATLKAIISQRLVRKLCTHCKQPLPQDQNPYPHIPAFTSIGCKHCNMQGFSGREAILEILEITPTIKPLLGNAPSGQIREFLKEKNFKTLFDDGIDKVAQGITTYEEIYRVVQK